jgi:hypothetical protein
MKKILIISETYMNSGAGNATADIFSFFQSTNFVSRLIIPYNKKNHINIINYYNRFTIFFYYLLKFFHRVFSRIVSKHKYYFFNNIFQNSFFSARKIKEIIKDFQPDYVMILWYEYILNYKEIYKIKNTLKVKIIIYPFDMYSFTGGCRYSQSCNNFKNNCRNCPAIILNKIPSGNYKINKFYLRKINPVIFFPSQYALDFANNSKILNKKTKKYIFYYPVVKKLFSNNNRLGLPSFKIVQQIKKKYNYKNIVFFGSQDGNEWRKGIYNINRFLKIFEKRFSKTYSETLFVYAGKNIKGLFPQEDKNFLVFNFLQYQDYYSIYSLADAVIIPSLQEWSSLMMSEAVILKKFIFSFNTGSSKDFLIEDITGNCFGNQEVSKFCNKLNDHLLNSTIYDNSLAAKKKYQLFKKVKDNRNNLKYFFDKNK